MLSKIIEWSGRNRFLVLLATLFIVIWGVFAVLRTPIDALPDLSDVQVIVYTEYPGQAPQVVEDQVTYPLTTAMLSVPKSKVVRGFSFFGASFVYIIFEDGTDIYWARSRVLEYLNFASGRMPKGITPQIGPDATGVGWVYQYALLAKDKTLAELRSIQDWYVRYQLTKAHGVAEVASIGGFVQTYQVTVDPQGDNVFYLGPNYLSLPSNSVCDLRSSTYGPAVWDNECKLERHKFTLTVVIKNAQSAHPSIQFSPSMRFNPRTRVQLFMFAPHVTATDAKNWQMMYCPDKGACYDESLTDKSLATFIDYKNNMVFRDVKHFSGYTVAERADSLLAGLPSL